MPSKPYTSAAGRAKRTAIYSTWLLTMDRGIEYQQHLPGYDIAVVLIVARSNRRQDVEPAMGEVNRLLGEVEPGQLYRVSA